MDWFTGFRMHSWSAEVACEHDLLVLTDEVYERLVFDDAVHTPLATFDGMAERTITDVRGA